MALTRVGYGKLGTGAGNTSNLTLAYTTVDNGIAPVAGNLVLWHGYGTDNVATPVQDLTGAGWTQFNTNNVGGDNYGFFLGKVVVAGDISAPPTIVSAPTGGAGGMWVAYSVTGTIGGLAILVPAATNGLFNAPSNVNCNMSALAGPMIFSSIGGGTDGTVDQAWDVGTPDFSDLATNLFSSGAVDFMHEVKHYGDGVVGDNITMSKGDDGQTNILSGFCLKVVMVGNAKRAMHHHQQRNAG